MKLLRTGFKRNERVEISVILNISTADYNETAVINSVFISTKTDSGAASLFVFRR
jgi:hypothetical protein